MENILNVLKGINRFLPYGYLIVVPLLLIVLIITLVHISRFSKNSGKLNERLQSTASRIETIDALLKEKKASFLRNVETFKKALAGYFFFRFFFKDYRRKDQKRSMVKSAARAYRSSFIPKRILH